MGYLVCEKCGGYYELQEGESIDDFQGCECGGKFKYVESIDGLNRKSDIKSQSDKSSSKIVNWWNKQSSNDKIGTVAVGGCILILLSFLVIGESSSNTTASTYSKSGSESNNWSTTGDIRIISKRALHMSGGYMIDGNVRNYDNIEIRYVEVRATGYDVFGNVVDTQTGVVTPSDIPSGGEGYYQVTLDDPYNKIVKYNVQVVK